MNNITNQDREIFKQIKAQFPNSYYRKPEVIAIFEKLTDVDTVVNKIRFMTLDLTHIPVCKTCGKELLNYNNSFCNNFCAAKNNELSFKKKQTCIEKYGVDNPAKSEIIKTKIKKTNLEKYGVEHNWSSTELRDKTNQLYYNKTGYTSINQNPKVKDVKKKVCMEKYGVDNPAKSAKIKDKKKQTCIEKYGVDNIFKSDTFITQNLKNKRIKYVNELEQTDYKIIDHNSFIDIGGMYDIQHKCGYIYKSTIFGQGNWSVNNLRCPKCFPQRKSYNEFKINDIFDNIFQNNTRKIIPPLELDLYSEKHKLAIEYDGLMFHSYGISKLSYLNNTNENCYQHLNKTQLCNEIGVSLLHIFESEWCSDTKKSIWISIISNKLGLNENKVFARKCVVKHIDSKTKNKFLNENHLQGEDKSSIKLGLYYENEIVAVITFGKPRYNSRYEYELIRFSVKKNVSVVGGFSKILKYFIKDINPKSIITYADKRYSNGDVYKKNGFNELKDSKPNYFYFKPNTHELKSRIHFQKHKLKLLLDNFDENLTETQNMFNNGYRKIYDCGNKVFELVLNN